MANERVPNHPLAEVFGFPPDNLSEEAKRHRKHRLCPFNNGVPNCTKDKANDPLGVCTIWDGDGLAITCPIRLRQDWVVTDDTASFFFGDEPRWTSLLEVSLKTQHAAEAGKIDVVLVSYDGKGQVTDFGALEIQAVYISGNIRRPFEHYMEDPKRRHNMNWSGEKNYPRADYLSSSRKRLVPQLIYKGGILHSWGKKIAVAIHQGFFATLPPMPETEPEKAELGWFVYDLVRDSGKNIYQLVHVKTVYTLFESSLERITTAEPSPVEQFIEYLQEKLDEKLENEIPPETRTLDESL